MASKQPSPLEEEPPLVASLSLSEEEEEQVAEEEQTEPKMMKKKKKKKNNNNNINKASRKPETQQPQSSSEEEEGSDSDTLNPKPVVTLTKSKKRPPLENSEKNSDENSDENSEKNSEKNSGGGGDDGKESKRAKKNIAVAAEADGEKKEKKPLKLFQRLWSLDDEPVILKGIMDYSSITGANPITITEGDAFHKFINKSLSINVTSTQLVDKMRKLKLKYKKNVARGKTTFSKPHQQKLYDLSMKLWGAAAAAAANKPLTPPKKEEEMINENLLIMMSNHHTSNAAGESVASFIEEGLSLIDLDKKSELNEKVRELQLGEMKMFIKRSELQCEVSKLCLDAVNINNNKKKKKKKKKN